MKRKLIAIGLIMCWFALIGQFVLLILNRQAGIPETIIRFFSFFTILTNIMVALYFTMSYINSKKNPLNLFISDGALTALTTFILIVGLVYQVSLRHIWNPTGLQFVVDELLHTVIPIYLLIYWFRYSNKNDLETKSVLYWLLYPMVYITFIFSRGYISGYYPYPFLNIPEIGIQSALFNIGIILGVSILIMISLIITGNFRKNLIKK
ncbi:Pr6Pr family membrane protein [Arenibacter sp. BSSL-BM3]|uniref:Pr6Pr family membrane protein n=1 Tax=Arenibacter arenosicollis TaxID=2762274 RepID=A0ABR7QU26_9FLAO|nr:Pr6Pr family membrane protein [Arenibacter arenosicollis]MBC8770475.1 Pr6Pr family membrane protein [Arenibacter arenosicollis]